MLASILRVLTPLFLTFTAIPAPPAPDPAAPNAAARYMALFESLNPDLAKQAIWILPDAEQFAIEDYGDLDFTAEDLRRTLIDQQPWINALIAAAALPDCDLGLEIEPFGQLTPRPGQPPLKPFRSANAILLADAARCWTDGEADAATARLEAALRLAHHVIKQDNALYLWPIATSYQLQKTAEAGTRFLASSRAAALTADHRARVLAAVNAFDLADPAGLRRATKTELTRFIDFAAEELEDGEVGDRLVIQLSQMRASAIMTSNLFNHMLKKAGADDLSNLPLPKQENLFAEVARQSELMTHEILSARLSRAREIASQLDAAWDAPDAKPRLRAIDEECEADETALLYTALFGQWTRCERWTETRAKFSELRAALTP